MPKNITARIMAENGTSIANLVVAYGSSDSTVATVASGGLYGQQRGTAKVTASTYAYGVSLADSVTYIIGYPTYQNLGIAQHPPATGTERVTYFSPDTVTIGIGGVILFMTDAKNSKDISIVFDEPSAATAPTGGIWALFADPSATGNIAPLPPGQSLPNWAFRQFNTPGIYRFHDGDNQAVGWVAVREDTP
jgi:hypothetical protein